MIEALEKPISIEDILRNVRGPFSDWLAELDKNKSLEYRAKISLAMTGMLEIPCGKHEKNNNQGCQWLRTKEEDFKNGADAWCNSKCEYPMDIKYMNPAQINDYIEKRSPEKMKIDILGHPRNKPIYLAFFSEEQISEILS